MRRETKPKSVLLDGANLVAKYNAYLKTKTSATPLKFSDEQFTVALVRPDREEQDLKANRDQLIPYPLPEGSSISFGPYQDLYINVKHVAEDDTSSWDYYEIPYVEFKKILDKENGERIPADPKNSFRDGAPVTRNTSLKVTHFADYADHSCDIQIDWVESRMLPDKAPEKKTAVQPTKQPAKGGEQK